MLSQSVTASDVTEQYIDLSARLKNLKAEEVRLRSFLNQTDKVSELLQVERELARVRGEIESTQAQVDYLERQAARATLVVSLSEPGPVVRPQGDDWGFSAAITRGVQAAVALLTTLVTGLIAIAPLVLLGVAIWLIVRAIRKRRHSQEPDAPSASPSPDEPQDSDRVIPRPNLRLPIWAALALRERRLPSALDGDSRWGLLDRRRRRPSPRACDRVRERRRLRARQVRGGRRRPGTVR